MEVSTEKSVKVWDHWGYSVIPVLNIIAGVFYLAIGLIPQLAYQLGIADDILLQIQADWPRGVLLALIGISFWPIKHLLTSMKKQASKGTPVSQ